MPSVFGALGVPVPSIHESFCSHLKAIWPAVFTSVPPGPAPCPLKSALAGGVAVSVSFTEEMDHSPAP